MNALVFEHVPVAELPQKWRVRLTQAGSATLTVRIEEEVQAVPAEEFVTDDPLFGMWRDREDMADVPAMCASCAPRGSMTIAHGATADDGAGRLRCAGVESLHALPAWRISALTYIELAQGCRDKTELARLNRGPWPLRWRQAIRPSRRPCGSASPGQTASGNHVGRFGSQHMRHGQVCIAQRASDLQAAFAPVLLAQ